MYVIGPITKGVALFTSMLSEQELHSIVCQDETEGLVLKDTLRPLPKKAD